MQIFDFKKLAGLTPQKEPHLAAPRGVAIGSDGDQYETPPIGDAAATARLILKAAATRDAGGPMMPKPSTVAQQILDAGEKRRAGG